MFQSWKKAKANLSKAMVAATLLKSLCPRPVLIILALIMLLPGSFACFGKVYMTEDQAREAIKDKNYIIRARAVGNLSDQKLLAKVALEDESDYVRKEAIEELKDQALLVQVVEQSILKGRKVESVVAVARIEDAETLRSYINESGPVARMAEIKLSLLHPLLSPSKIVANGGRATQKYSTSLTPNPYLPPARTLSGDNWWMRVEACGGKYSSVTIFSPQFPMIIKADTPLPGPVRIESVKVLRDLLTQAKFSQDVLSQIALDPKATPELRRACIPFMTNRDTLAKIAKQDKDLETSLTAKHRLEKLQ